MRGRQALVLAVGVAAAAVMSLLGLWQMRVFMDQGSASAEERAHLAPVALSSVVAPDSSVSDGYGRPVTATGTYLPDQQVVARDSDGRVRLVAALRLADGRVLPVVLGVPGDGGEVPVPEGDASVTGVFLASDKTPDPAPSLQSGEVAAVRLPVLAQRWPQQLMPGYLTLGSDDAAALGLSGASLALPEGEGSIRNEGYAVQWWAFAAFAIGISLKIARDIGTGSTGVGRTMGGSSTRASADSAAVPAPASSSSSGGRGEPL
ncbi:SURF1 family protein [Propionicicella superfundia]|uniref:SURF1 family protein n=1 Tax=Propionicicella superfundia TaxID=348582 RepID=UPI0003F8A58D|nr:SURF1 family protein [Propionicicella superfundia]